MSRTDEAILDYMDAARDLRDMASTAAGGVQVYEQDGMPYTPVELYAFAAIAERAADAEADDPQPVGLASRRVTG
jgi:hypothetical protein